MPNPTVAYFYDPDVGNFHYGKSGRTIAPITDRSGFETIQVKNLNY